MKLLIILFVLFFTSNSYANPCEEANIAKVESWIKENPESKNIVFFASWCAGCELSLKEAKKNDLVVAVLDELNLSNKLYEIYAQNKPKCFYGDQSVVEGMNVKYLPYKKGT